MVQSYIRNLNSASWLDFNPQVGAFSFRKLAHFHSASWLNLCKYTYDKKRKYIDDNKRFFRLVTFSQQTCKRKVIRLSYACKGEAFSLQTEKV